MKNSQINFFKLGEKTQMTGPALKTQFFFNLLDEQLVGIVETMTR